MSAERVFEVHYSLTRRGGRYTSRCVRCDWTSPRRKTLAGALALIVHHRRRRHGIRR